jgi:hypothetical protein
VFEINLEAASRFHGLADLVGEPVSVLWHKTGEMVRNEMYLCFGASYFVRLTNVALWLVHYRDYKVRHVLESDLIKDKTVRHNKHQDN